MVREQPALVGSGLVEQWQEGGRVARKGKGGIVGLRGDRAVDERFEGPLLADHAAHEAVVVLEERVGECRAARFLD